MKNRLYYIILLLVVIFIWQYFGDHNNTVRLLISSPSLILQYFKENLSALLTATTTTLLEAAIGLLIATTFSFFMMIVCFYKPRFMNFIMPLMITSQVIPLIVLAPFFIILFGIGLTSKIAMSALLCFFPIFVNFAQGYKLINTNIHELMHIYNATTRFRIRNVYFPLTLPNIMAGLKVSTTLSVIGAIVAEFSGAETGLGKNLFISALRLEPELMMSSLLLSSVIGLLFYACIRILENKLIKWI